MAKYVRVGREVRRAMQALTPLVEPLSIDEAFLDLSGTERIHGAIPALTLARFALQVQRDIGITVSVGLSCNKFLAKVASDLDKPRGFAVLDQDDGRNAAGDKPVSFIYGVGPATQQRLQQQGFRLISDFQRADENELMKQFGSEGRRLWRLAARHRRPQGRAGSRHEGAVGGDDVRDRPARSGEPGAHSVAVDGEGVVTAEDPPSLPARPSR